MKFLNLYLIIPLFNLGCQNMAAMGDEKSAVTEVESVKPAGLDKMEQGFLFDRLHCCSLRHAKGLTKESKDEHAWASKCGLSDVNAGWADCESYTDCKKRHSDIVTCASQLVSDATRPFDQDRIDAEMTRCVDDLTKQRKVQTRLQSMWDPRITPYTKCIAGLSENIFAITKKQSLHDLKSSESEHKRLAAEFDKCSTKLTADKR